MVEELTNHVISNDGSNKWP